MPPRPLLIIAQECLQRLTGTEGESGLSIQGILDQCHSSLGTPKLSTVLEDLRELALSLGVPFEEAASTSTSSSSAQAASGSTETRKKKYTIRVVCETCGKELSSGAAFASHMRTHSKEAEADFQTNIQDFGLSPEQIVENVLIHSVVEPVIRRVEKEIKFEKMNSIDGRKLNRKGGNKHRKTYTLSYKAKCIELVETAALTGVPSPQVDVARSEQIDISMLGRWISAKDKIIASVAAQGHKKILSKDKIDKKALGKKKRKRKTSVDLSSVGPPSIQLAQIQQQQQQQQLEQHFQQQFLHNQQQQHLQQQQQQQQQMLHNQLQQQQPTQQQVIDANMHLILLPEMQV